jgi:hypothetical protein
MFQFSENEEAGSRPASGVGFDLRLGGFKHLPAPKRSSFSASFSGKPTRTPGQYAFPA